ncbi:MAG: substrate-binding periplasmic protein [Kordiimonas sp.]
MIIATSFTPLVLADETTIDVAQIDWCPQICPKQEQAGYIVDVVAEAFKDSSYKLRFQTLPWSRAIIRVQEGAAEALLSPAKAEAPGLMYPVHHVGWQRMCFLVKDNSNWKYDGLASLDGIDIGVARNTSITELDEYLAKNGDQFHFMPYTKDYVPLSLRMLNIGRFDTFIFTINSTLYKINQMGLKDKVKSAGCLTNTPVYMAFTPVSAKSEKMQKAAAYLDGRLVQMMQEGRIGAIMAKYGLPDWTKFDANTVPQ